jgi:hypothetical protein
MAEDDMQTVAELIFEIKQSGFQSQVDMREAETAIYGE